MRTYVRSGLVVELCEDCRDVLDRGELERLIETEAGMVRDPGRALRSADLNLRTRTAVPGDELGPGLQVAELGEGVNGRADRELAGERGQAPVAGHEDGPLGRGECQEVVVVRVGRADRRTDRRDPRRGPPSGRSRRRTRPRRRAGSGGPASGRPGRAASSASSAGETTSSKAPACQATSSRAGLPRGERTAEIRTLASRTARTGDAAGQPRVRCWASTASASASASSRSLAAHSRSSRSRPRSRRSASSITSLSPLPRSGGSDLHRAEHLGIDRQGRAHLRHHRIIASRCAVHCGARPPSRLRPLALGRLAGRMTANRRDRDT